MAGEDVHVPACEARVEENRRTSLRIVERLLDGLGVHCDKLVEKAQAASTHPNLPGTLHSMIADSKRNILCRPCWHIEIVQISLGSLQSA